MLSDLKTSKSYSDIYKFVQSQLKISMCIPYIHLLKIFFLSCFTHVHTCIILSSLQQKWVSGEDRSNKFLSLAFMEAAPFKMFFLLTSFMLGCKLIQAVEHCGQLNPPNSNVKRQKERTFGGSRLKCSGITSNSSSRKQKNAFIVLFSVCAHYRLPFINLTAFWLQRWCLIFSRCF